ncbi:putative thiamine transporter SLC35F3 [Galendromus occidentalis]|uniref:Thiamine transporter SLC35F3 n=1 Tax=Galendromus occidentalis TaxID=34638 RepID=A0AAJ7WGY9_9ACAR|nr:putative thiamine transporter SLC35F3 [Galendromus occidentalis]
MMLVTMPLREIGLTSVGQEGEAVPKNPSIQKLKTSSSHSIHTNGSNNQLASNQNSITRQNSANNSFAGEQLAQEIAVGRRCCTENSRKVAAGIVMTALIALSWVGAAHCLKQTYNRPRNRTRLVEDTSADNSTEAEFIPFDAPFFTTWLCTAFNVLFLPVFLIGRQCWSRGTTCRVIIDTLQRFQEKQLSFSQFFARCGLFTVMWIVTNLLLVFGLRLLDTTDVLALYSAHVAFVYLLSWVILHQQFVGVRIVAIILVNTGVALLAYMDGVSGTTTLVGVVLSATAAGLSGVYKVTFKKLIGDVTFGQLAMFFSLIGFLNIVLLWPLVLCSYLLNLENLVWEHMPWGLLFGAGALSLTANLLGNLGIACTFEMFLTLGLAFAVPISAIVDIYMYEVVFQGMKLAGILLILLGFMLVQLPDDWPDYLTMLLRYSRPGASRRHSNQESKASSIHDMATGHRSGLRTASGRVK